MEGVCCEWAKKADGHFWRKEVEGFLELGGLILFLKNGKKVKNNTSVEFFFYKWLQSLKLITLEF